MHCIRKLLKFYFQSFLLGVPVSFVREGSIPMRLTTRQDIVVGFRTPAGVLNGLQHYKTMQIPRMVRGRGGTWNAIVCMGWGYELLSFIRKKIAADTRNGAGEDAVWRARVVPGTGAQLMKLDRAGVEEVSAGEDRIGFLPRWYWQESLGISDNL
jgi:RAT1-interacting protein